MSDAARDVEGVRGYRIRGVVQGVGFRWATAREGERLGLRGWVRNAADGSVEVGAAGDVGALGRFEAWLAVGPVDARVVEVERVEWERPLPGEGFSIER